MKRKRRIRKKLIMRLFPQLQAHRFRITSLPTAQYNCLAWAVMDNRRWWEPAQAFYWPPGVVRGGVTVSDAVAAYRSLGFEICANGELEPGCDKLAIYADARGYTHVARQLENGRWASKLGELEDIEHDSLDDLACGDYGQVDCFMRKERV